MLVEASVGEAEVHRVQPGQPATVRVEAFPDLRLTGKVSRVGTLASASATRPFDDKRFDLIIELDPTTTELRPEMTARADIVVGTRKDVLLVPVTAVFEHQGSFVAYVVGRNRHGDAAHRPGRVERPHGRSRQRSSRGRARVAHRACQTPRRPARPAAARPMRFNLAELGRVPPHRGRGARPLRLRTALSVLGVVLGVAAVIAMMSVSEGAAREALTQVEALGLDNLVARTAGGLTQAGVMRKSLTLADADAGRRARPHRASGVSAGGPLRQRRAGRGIPMAPVIGVRPSYQAILRLRVERGRFLSSTDEQTIARICVLGAHMARKLFGYRDPVGEHVRIAQDYYQVVGVLGEHGFGPAAAPRWPGTT